MVSTITGFAKSGLKDWFIQRVSAIILAVYVLFLVGFFIVHPQVDYGTWKALFSQTCMRIFTLLAVLSLAAHAWIGLWTVFTDYIKCGVLRGILQVSVILVIFVYVVWTIQIIWGV
ncbi:succinate dehydrogenase [Piscirickettsia salmonis]|uniref:Succinate dehydrogenase hydrophobic membrane anchor subunit n=1 Tax=Piscirickettsia salmonis TaxID=1238 RepID=A0A0K2E0H2_PISSA|nr:succinate dehydrogenase, hydrophobic membrane anchor protein [Piscirickettsia salmonis]RNC78966.1 succinate dehydrogenase, hydrophobic membrane anchor protein [Piscirickettsiaceae bacterium NZ-RLO2]AKP72961.1 succinate dehydrogenase [Piscirickettsia salmonis LF-89 = ATCC VR-1361]ALA26125.1 succinate dehydrogenase, hydrophobic membrane anchor protein [Piscirickettsia salmonis]ALB21588.1 succinate dehydrogenase, hydrophobic membrane anchor protein [Piscirickettsia salmonis]ALY01795.1 succinat